jgi:hypothetical protein
MVGDLMVDRSIRMERLRPLVVLKAAASGREPRALRELAGSFGAISQLGGLARKIETLPWGQSSSGSSAAGPSSRNTWKERRASLRAIVSEARVWDMRSLSRSSSAWSGLLGRQADCAAS